MAKNRMSDLRDHLFETLEDLRDKDKPMDLARAKAVVEVAQTLINSAKVEVDLMKVIGAEEGSEFLGRSRVSLPIPAGGERPQLVGRQAEKA